MKITEIRQEIIAHILADISLSLSRLGVSENVEIEKTTDDYMTLTSKPIKQMPMMFKKVTIDGTLYFPKDDSVKLREGDVLIEATLNFRTVTFDDGHNGTKIGYVRYRISAVPKDNILPDELRYFVRKIRGLEI